jgi:hypothetical protein
MTWRSISLALAVAAAGCTAHRSAPSLPADGVAFSSATGHVSFAYPKSWHPAADDSLLTLIPASEKSLGRNHLAIDMPNLPPHIPFLIPLGSVESGFVDDLKKRYKDVKVDPSRDRSLDGAAGREVTARGSDETGPVAVKAVVCVKGDHVYLIVAETDASGAAAALRAFNMVADSLHWTD